jgi:hypothetical protein
VGPTAVLRHLRDILWEQASVRGLREGWHQDAGLMQFRRVHLRNVLSLAVDGLDPDITGTAFLRDLESLRSTEPLRRCRH